MILACQNISKSFGVEPVIRNVSFHVEDQEKVAIVGINGAGKSTLLKIIVGELPADEGTVTLAKGKTLGYLAQHQDMDDARTIYETVLEGKRQLIDMEQKIRELEEGMQSVSKEEMESYMESYHKLLHEFEARDGYSYRSEVSGVLKGLGFSENDFEKHCNELSGGQKRRVAIAGVLAMKPEVLILDEQILEEGSREALIGYLKQEEHIGEDVYVFRTDMLGDVFHWKGARESSIGEYLQGIQENRTSGQQKKGVTLREVYHQFYKDGTLPWLPSVWVNSDLLEVDYGNSE